MARFIDLIVADGTHRSIPPHTIWCVQGMHKGQNPNFEDAECCVFYRLNAQIASAILLQDYNDVIRMLDINVRPADWVQLTLADGNRFAIRDRHIVGLTEVKDEDPAQTVVEIVDTEDKLIVPAFKFREPIKEVHKLLEENEAKAAGPGTGIGGQVIPLPGLPGGPPANQ